MFRGPASGEATVNKDPDTAVSEMQQEDDPRRVRVRLAGLLVPNVTGAVFRAGGTGFVAAGEAFVSQDGNTFFTAGAIHAGKKGESAAVQDRDPDGETVQPARFAIGKIGRSSSSTMMSVDAGVSAGVLGAGAGFSRGLSQQKTDVLDMNGDGFLDVVVGAGMPGPLSDTTAIVDADKTSHVRLTSPVSLSTQRAVAMNGHLHLSRDVSGHVNLGVSPPMVDISAKGNVKAMVSRFPGFGGGLAFSVGSVLEQLVDVNGDGLPDQVRVSGGGCSSGEAAVRLNLGTSFAAGVDCVNLDPRAFPVDSNLIAGVEPDALRRSATVTLQGTGGGTLSFSGGTDASESFGASVTGETSLTATNVALVDVTGDGLPDYVHKASSGDAFNIRVNTGYGFADQVTWGADRSWSGLVDACLPRLHLDPLYSDFLDGLGVPRASPGSSCAGIQPLEATGSHSVLPSVGFAVDFTFPLFLVAPWMHVGVGANASTLKVSGFELGLMDIDGDGLPDQVLKTSDNAPVWARLNQLGKANLLTKVVRPLGGSIDLAYDQRLGNTVEMPQSRWVLTKVVAKDGRGAGTGHELTTLYAYGKGRHDRIEREFLGFDKVTRANPDGTSVEQRFMNDTVLVKGLLVSERVLGREPDKRVLVETENLWSRAKEPAALAQRCKDATPVLLDANVYCGSSVTKLDAVVKRFHEGESAAGIVTRQEFVYDDHGEVTIFKDLGDVADPRDDLKAVIVYASDGAAETLYSVSRPKSVIVTGPDGATLRSRTAEYDAATGNLKILLADLGGAAAETELNWNTNGTLDWVEGPKNETGQRYKTTYGYDPVTESYVTSITDSHGYTSSAEYDLRFGEATKTVDVNGKVTSRRFDAFGRLERIAGPKDALDAPTVQTVYAHEAAVPYAWTKNRLPRSATDGRGTVDTVVMLDGLGRVIQTKKKAEIATSATTKGVGWSVTGHQVFDEMGRVRLQGQTFASFGSMPGYVTGAPRNPTRFDYDELGRVVQTLEPNSAVTRVEYGFGTPAGSIVKRFKTTTTDAEGKGKAAYKDAGDRVVAVEERIDGRTPTTHYEYSPVGDLLKVIDAAGNETVLGYDLLGRRTRLENPDTGELRFDLDPAGNLVRKYDPNLDAKSQSIHYVYDFEQLTRIEYPDATRNVTYTYGSVSSPGTNGIGRVIEVKDDAGTETRSYGELGELSSTTRILRPLEPGDRERTFTTSFTWDSFGRMMSITYPDGETVSYGYDAGGLLEKATGRRPAGGAVPGEEVYLASMMYDEFGQRVRMLLGNGVVSSYGYEPLTRRLSTLDTDTPLGRKLQRLRYGYDRVGNVKTMVNAIGEPVRDQSGTVAFEFRYDDLHRLTWAAGSAKSRVHTIDRYTATYAYSDVTT